MIWLILIGYTLALALLWVIIQWDSKNRTLLSFAVLIFYGCSLATAGPVAMFVYAATHMKPTCTCEMVKNHECIQN